MKLFNKKGQLTIINIFYFFILVIVAAVVTPITSDIITSTIGLANLTATQALIMNMVIVFIWLAVLITLFMYVMPQRPQQY